MKYSVPTLISALFLSACASVANQSATDSEEAHTQAALSENQTTWVLVLIDLNTQAPTLEVEGSYGRMDKCFLKREKYVPKWPEPGTQAVCIRME